ncbi:MAG: hypothetical protein ACLFUF_01240 [Opitutales bacterium]
MLKFYYQWRFRRAQRAGAYRLPTRRRGSRHFLRENFGNYLSQRMTPKCPSLGRYDLSRKRRRLIRTALLLLLLLAVGWLVYESIQAFTIIRN